MGVFGIGRKEVPLEAPVSHTAALEEKLATLIADRDAKDEWCKSLHRQTVTSTGIERAGLLQDLGDARGELSIVDAEIAKLRAPLARSRELDERAALIAAFRDVDARGGKAAEDAIKAVRTAVLALSEAGALGRAASGLSLELGGPALGYGLHPSIIAGIDRFFFERLYVGEEISRFDEVRFPTLVVTVDAPETRRPELIGGLIDEAAQKAARAADLELAARAGTSTK